MFRMPCLLNDQRCSSHCLDTSARWTVARHISARHRWENVDTRPAKPSIPSVGKDSRDELVDGLLVSGALRPGDSLLSRGTAESDGASARARLQRVAGRLL